MIESNDEVRKLSIHIFNLLFFHYFTSFYSRFLGNIKDAFVKNPELKNLLLDDFFMKEIHKCQVLFCHKFISQLQ